MSDSLIVQAVDRMILNQQLGWVKQHQFDMPKDVFRSQFQTVKISLPRRSGHTTAAATLWMKYDAIVVCPTYESAKRFLREDLKGRVYISRSYEIDLIRARIVVVGRSHGVESFNRFTNGIQWAGTTQPQLLVFDESFRFDTPALTLKSIQQMISQQQTTEDLAELCFKLASCSHEHIVEEITETAFHRFPTLKGVVHLQ